MGRGAASGLGLGENGKMYFILNWFRRQVLTIVITDFRSSFFLSFFLLRSFLLTHFEETPEAEILPPPNISAYLEEKNIIFW